MAKKIKTKSEISRFQKLSIIEGTKAYAKLREDVINQGILERAYGYYGLLAVFIFSGLLFTSYNLIIQQNTALLIVWGVLFAFFSVQLGGFIHDSGHRTIFKSAKMNDLCGQICATLLAMCYDDWKIGHNKHHAHPNQEGQDPDIELPFSFTEDRYKGKKGLIGFIRKHQVYLYFPLGSFTWLFTRTTGVKFYIKEFQMKNLWKTLLFALGIFFWFILPFLVFDFKKAFLLFVVVNPLID